MTASKKNRTTRRKNGTKKSGLSMKSKKKLSKRRGGRREEEDGEEDQNAEQGGEASMTVRAPRVWGQRQIWGLGMRLTHLRIQPAEPQRLSAIAEESEEAAQDLSIPGCVVIIQFQTNGGIDRSRPAQTTLPARLKNATTEETRDAQATKPMQNVKFAEPRRRMQETQALEDSLQHLSKHLHKGELPLVSNENHFLSIYG